MSWRSKFSVNVVVAHAAKMAARNIEYLLGMLNSLT
jgi:hypothetical protein